MELSTTQIILIVGISLFIGYYFTRHQTQRMLRHELYMWFRFDVIPFFREVGKRIKYIGLAFYGLLIIYSVYGIFSTEKLIDQQIYMYFLLPFNSIFLGFWIYSYFIKRNKSSDKQIKTSVSEMTRK